MHLEFKQSSRNKSGRCPPFMEKKSSQINGSQHIHGKSKPRVVRQELAIYRKKLSRSALFPRRNIFWRILRREPRMPLTTMAQIDFNKVT